MSPFGWHVQILMTGDQIAAHEGAIRALPTPVVIDHLGRIPEPDGVQHPGFAAVRRLLERGVSIAAVKLGAGGCCVATTEQQYRAPAFRIEAIDTNGCGDAFVAGFLHAHLAGRSLTSCATLANALGALTATRSGAAEALPERSTLRAFLFEHCGEAPLVGLLES